MIESMVRSASVLFILFSIHIVVMMNYEGFSFADSLWLTLTTATTVGYGDISATTAIGRIATVLCIYVGGIFILGKTVGDYFDYRSAMRDKKNKGLWSWDMQNHIVILNTPSDSGERYLQRLIKQFRCSKRYAETPILLLTRQFPNGLPNFITELGNVAHFNGDAANIDNLKSVNVQQADDIIVLSKAEHDDSADGRTFDILHRLKEMHVEANILAECVVDSNRQRLKDAGAFIIIRPIRAYPEMIVRAFVTPGSEHIIENMFNSQNDEYKRYDVAISNVAWGEIVSRLVCQNAGIAVAYIEQGSNQMVYNPDANSIPKIQALIAICKDDNQFKNSDIASLMSA